MTAINNKYQLTTDELYTYLLISYASGNNESGHLTIEYINQICDFKEFYKFNNRKSRNVKRIECLILSLENKGVIHVNGNINEMFEVNFVKDLSDKNLSGYERIESSLLEKIDRPLEAYIYITILKWNAVSKKEYISSYEQWAKLLNCSIQTTYDAIWSCSEKKIITINQGEYINREDSSGIPRQGSNRYLSIPLFENQNEFELKKQEEEDDNFSEENTNKHSGWHEFGNISVEDMKEYLLSDDPEFRKICEKKMNNIHQNMKAKGKDFSTIKKTLEGKAMNQIEKEDKPHVQRIIDEVGDVVIRTKEGLIPYDRYNNEAVIGFWYKDEQTSFSQTTNQSETTMELKFISGDIDIKKIKNYRPVDKDSWKVDKTDDPFAGLD